MLVLLSVAKTSVITQQTQVITPTQGFNFYSDNIKIKVMNV